MNQKNTHDMPMSVRMSLAQDGEKLVFDDELCSVTITYDDDDDDGDNCYNPGTAKRQFRRSLRATAVSDKKTYCTLNELNSRIFNTDPS